MPPYKSGNLTIYYYGDDDAPAGTGKGKQNFGSLYNDLKKEEKFMDPLFPADKSTLTGLDFTFSDGRPQDVQWFRPNVIAEHLFPPNGKFGRHDSFYSNSPESHESHSKPIFMGALDQFCVNQGTVGDCWFLSVLADVTKFPSCINTIIPDDNGQHCFDKGIFHFRFWCRGKWIDIVIDDQLPCIVQFGRITSTAFSKPTEKGGFWAPLLEKAYAKLYGNYSNIAGGFPVDAMKDFTGGFIQKFINSKTNPIDWKSTIIESKNAHCIMSVATVQTVPVDHIVPRDSKNPGPEYVSDDGIVCGHAYSCLDIQDVHDIHDPKISYTLVKLRNPWGNNTEWSGAFNDKDRKWESVTPNLRSNPDDIKDDGEFWIPLDDLVRYIGTFDTCLWSGKFRGEDGVLRTDKWGMVEQVSEYYTDANVVHGGLPSGQCHFKTDLMGKPGYYVHLRSMNPNSGEIKNGLRYNCGLIVNLMYENYIKSGNNSTIPLDYGYYVLWGRGEEKPEGSYFNRTEYFDLTFNSRGGARDVNTTITLPEGTAFIVPWISSTPTEKTPYLLRICAEGEIYKYPN